MIFILIVLLIIAANIVGCVRSKKTAIKTFFGIAAGIWMFFAVISGWFVFETGYKVVDVDSSKSPDGAYKLYFQQVGEPDWPFGYTHAQLVLKSEGKTIVRYIFDIANDGASMGAEDWQVTWNNDCVSTVIFGEEQYDRQYILYFDGKKEEHQLKTQYGVIQTENQSESQNENGSDSTQSESQTKGVKS